MSDLPRDARGFRLQGEIRYDEQGRQQRLPAIYIPWSAAEIAYAEYAKQYGPLQSLERLAQRGGFGRDEFLSLLVEAAQREERER